MLKKAKVKSRTAAGAPRLAEMVVATPLAVATAGGGFAEGDVPFGAVVV